MSIETVDAEGMAQSLADAEGLALIRADNQSGYRYVTVDPRKSTSRSGLAYRARGTGTHKFSLGEFFSAHEAALAVARFLGPKVSHEKAAVTGRQVHGLAIQTEFGVPRKRGLDDTSEQTATVVECCVVEAESSDGGGSGGSGALTVIPAEIVAVTISTPGSAASALTQEGDDTAAHERKRPVVRPSRASSTTWTTRHEKPAVTVVDGIAYFAVDVPVGVSAPACLTVEWAS